jgi:NTP pyrophosphatase (non-canonical NTP hydrolase)
MMDFNDYQEHITELDLYPKNLEGTLAVVLGLGNEAGEVQGKYKKLIRDGVLDESAIIAELGDIIWYVATLARRLGYGFDTVAVRNLEKLFDRQKRGVLRGSGDNR